MGATLKDRQWELDERYLFGLGYDCMVENFAFGEVDLEYDDRKMPNTDGELSGPESYGGRTITFDLTIYTGDGTWADKAMEELTAAWRRCRNRTVVLRYKLFGRVRRVYGRCRRLAPPADGFDPRHGVARFTAEFRCHDGFTYSDELEFTEIKMEPAAGTGFSAPFGGVIQMQGENPPMPGLITVEGSFPVAISAEVEGPIQDPIIDVSELWAIKVNHGILEGQKMEVDTSLWNKGIRLDGTKNIAGKLSPTSPKLSGCLIPPGQWSVILRGKSSTGTARCVLKWRQCFTSY